MTKRNGLIGLAVAAVVGLSLVAGVPAWAHDGEEEDGHIISHELGGVHIDGGVTWYLQGTSGVGTNDSTDLTYSFDLGIQAQVGEHGTINAALETGGGNGVDGRMGALSTANYDAFVTDATNTVNGVAGDGSATDLNAPNLSQLYYEGEYADGRMVVDFGKLDIHAMYDTNAYANDETDQFMSAMFTRSAGTSYGELDRYYAPGLAVSGELTDMVSVMALVANGNGSGFDAVSDHPYTVAQLTVSPELVGREGNYRFYGIYDARNFTDIASGSTETNTAWGISLDQALTENLGVFGRYSAQDDKLDENAAKSTWSLGLSASGGAWGRGDDVIGIGYGSVVINKNSSAFTGIANPDDENHLEVYYKVALSDHVTITPDVQVVSNVGGDGDADTVTVYGVRGQMNF